MRKIFVLSVIFILVIFPFVSAAITGAIGNGRVVLRPELEEGEQKTIERTLLVRNPNDVAVDIELKVTESIKDIIELIDETFVLGPGEDKEARFNVVLEDTRSYQGSINVFFNFEGRQGIVLSSTMVVLGDTELDDDNFNEEENEEQEDIEIDLGEVTGDVTNEDDVSISFGNSPDKVKAKGDSFGGVGLILTIILGLVVLALGGFLFFLKK